MSLQSPDHDGFTEGWVKKINYEKFPFTDTVALFHISIADFFGSNIIETCDMKSVRTNANVA